MSYETRRTISDEQIIQYLIINISLQIELGAVHKVRHTWRGGGGGGGCLSRDQRYEALPGVYLADRYVTLKQYRALCQAFFTYICHILTANETQKTFVYVLNVTDATSW